MTKTLDDQEILKQLGVASMDSEAQSRVLGHFYETLQLRVASRLEKQLSDDQLADFNKTASDFAASEQWMQSNLSDYRQVIMDEADRLLKDIQADTKLIVEKADKQRQS